jgi:hypothetical protein
MKQTSTRPAPVPLFRVLEPVPPEPSLELVPDAPAPLVTFHRSGRNIVVENGASIPTTSCIKSGRPVFKTMEVSLRNPANPKTWFGRRPAVEVGLSRKYYENYIVAVALTWSFLGVGALVLTAGIFALSPLTVVVGLIATAVSGVFRATSPVTSPDATETYATIAGAGDAYLKRLPVEV